VESKLSINMTLPYKWKIRCRTSWIQGVSMSANFHVYIIGLRSTLYCLSYISIGKKSVFSTVPLFCNTVLGWLLFSWAFCFTVV